MANIHFFCGSFDPPHLGHREIARISRQSCDKLIIFPTHQSPTKLHSPFSSDVDRFEMSKFNFSGISEVFIDDFELKSLNKNYTIDTINYLKTKYPDDKLTLVIGSDQWNDFTSWFCWEEILETVNILCFNREQISDNGNKQMEYPNVQFYSNFHYNISSNKIRSMFQTKDLNVKKILFPQVLSYIQEKGLYQV